MKIHSLICLFFLAGCQSPVRIPPEPQYVLNYHIDSIKLIYANNNESPSNLSELEGKTRDRSIRGRTSRHIYFPICEQETLTHKRVQFLKSYLSDRGYKVFQFKSDPSLTANPNQLQARIYVYNVFLPRYNNGDWTHKTAMLSNELFMLEDVAVLFDQSSLPPIPAQASASAIESYNKIDSGGDKAKGGGLGSAITGLTGGGLGAAVTGLTGGAPQ